MIRTLTFRGKRFDVVAVDLRTEEIRLFWKSDAGKPFVRLRDLDDYQRRRRQPLFAATNAGIFDKRQAPEGLYVEQGRPLVALNRRRGEGNFYLQPNGVFFVDRRGAGVLSAEDFIRNRIEPMEATQSGPMLVRNGVINPQFGIHSKSRCIRNGVGVVAPQKVFIAISLEPVTFHEFASLFREELGCPDALYLDGAISALYCPSHGRTGDGQFVAMLGVLKR